MAKPHLEKERTGIRKLRKKKKYLTHTSHVVSPFKVRKCKVPTGSQVTRYYLFNRVQAPPNRVDYPAHPALEQTLQYLLLSNVHTLERFCTTKIRTKFRDRPCENVYEFSHELCALHTFVVCTHQVHVRHDPISRNFLRKFISRSLQVSRPKLRKVVRSLSLRDVERKFVHIFVLQNLSISVRITPSEHDVLCV